MPTTDNELRLPRVSSYQERINRSLTDFYEDVPESHSAGQDWRLEAVQHINGYTSCELCGHFPIRRLFWIHNQVTGDTKCIGSECATNYVSVDLVDAYTRRIERFQSRRRNSERREQRRAEAQARGEELHLRYRQLRENIQHARTNHADVITFLNAYTGDDHFLTNVQHFMLERGYITDRQAYSVRRNMNVVTGPSIEEVADRVASSLDDPAGPDEATIIPNGVFTVSGDNGNTQTFRIHTVLTGQLAGKRIIKFQESDGTYSGFAFLTRGGDLRLWRRYAELEGNDISHAGNVLLSALPSYVRGGYRFGDRIINGEFRCRRCNRAIEAEGFLCERCEPATPAPVTRTRTTRPTRARSIVRDGVLMSEIQDGEIR